MIYLQSQTPYTCGIDLHAKKMHATIFSQQGKLLARQEMPCDEKAIHRFFQPFLGQLSVGVESTFNWYWLADWCSKYKIPFYLGHALYMKHIHGTKQKNDALDSRKIANLLRTGFFPPAYAYPQDMRTVRDLLRHRLRLVRMRSSIYTNIKNSLYQLGVINFPETIVASRKHWPTLLNAINDTATTARITSSLALIETLDTQIKALEQQSLSMAREQDETDLNLLKSIPGVGNILAMTILYETHTIDRFKRPGRYSSYARTVKVDHTSCGRITGGANAKIGNPYLSWAFAEVAFHARMKSTDIRAYYDALCKSRSPKNTLARLRHHFSVAVFYILKNKAPFDLKRFCHSGANDNSTVGLEKTMT
jgi:transposase